MHAAHTAMTRRPSPLLLLAALALLALQVLGSGRDLTADIDSATELMNVTYHNARDLQPRVYNFQQVLFRDVVPYVNDIEARMHALGIDPQKISELDVLYDTYMVEIRVIIQEMGSRIGPLYLGPTSKTMYDLNNALDPVTLTGDVDTIAANNALYVVDFAAYLGEIQWRIELLLVLNWDMIQGTSGPHREAIEADRAFIVEATSSYRDALVVHMDTLDLDTGRALAATNVVIAQLVA